MICAAIGLGLLGLFALRRARRCRGYGYGYGGCGPSGLYGHDGDGYGHGGHGWHGPWSPPWGRRGGRRWMLHAALARIDATPAQERAIVAEIDRLQERVRAVKSNLKDVRGDLAAAIRGASLDDAALGGALGRADGAHAEVRSAALDALRAIHGILDDKQRAQLADMLDRGGGWWRGGGPYR
jgi:uncharacterized membrane protein